MSVNRSYGWLAGGLALVNGVVLGCAEDSSSQRDSSVGGVGQRATTSLGGNSQAPNPGQGGSVQTPSAAQGGNSQAPSAAQGGNSQTPSAAQGGSSQTPSAAQGGSSQTPSAAQGGSVQTPSTGQGGNSQPPSTGRGGSSQAPITATGGSNPKPASGQGGSCNPHPSNVTAVAPPNTGFLHVEGSRLLDDAGKTARLTGVNWFGFETSNLSPHGLWARDYRSMLKQIRDVGFNTVRIPWCDAMLQTGAEARSVNTYGADPYDNTDPMNAPLEGKTPLEMLDLVIEAAGKVQLKVILDNHSRKPDGYMEEKVWYSDTVSEEQWITNWVSIAKRYRGNRTVIGFDLDNEPHGTASWAQCNATTDWNYAAERCGNAILAVNSDALIIVEGVEKVGTDGYWWGSNLAPARSDPIVLNKPEKLVYSAHEYGPEVFQQPWFEAAAFPSNLPGIWNAHYGFLMQENRGHVLVGEFGIKDPKAAEGRAQVWFDSFLAYAGSSYSWTFWCWNPNSGDTEGILNYDWLTTKQWKLDALKPHFAPVIE